ncbi:hypothetical protein ABTB97_22005, partial [Acinetobacter baumannii]
MRSETDKRSSITRKLGRLVAISISTAMLVVTAAMLWLQVSGYRDAKIDALRAAAGAFAASAGPAVAR